MPYKDPEKRREYQRNYTKKWLAAHPGKSSEYTKRWQAKNPEYMKEANKGFLERMEKWKADNPERAKELARARTKRWKLNHPEYNERANELRRVRHAANPEKYREYERERTRRRRAENPEQWREYHQEWANKNRGKVKSYRHNYKAALKGNGGSYTSDEEYELFAWQRGDCYYCGEFLYVAMPYHIDHKTPISRGGSNDISNIALTCPSCNLKKHTMTAEEFMERIK